MATPNKPRLFVDADVLFAGVAFPQEHSASLVVLRVAEITLVDAVTSQQAVEEARRNLAEKIPEALPAFALIVQRCLRVAPAPTVAEITPFTGLADLKDLPILVAAIQTESPYLVTFNTRHYQPGHPDVMILRPGEFLLRLRDLLTYL
ncbi:MAG: PIN domain-containing protein [Anaerolineae bacterium]